MKKKPSKRKPKNVSPDAGLPAADQRIAKHKRIEKVETDALHQEICNRVGKLRDDAEKTGDKVIAMINEARAVGMLIIEAWDKLPAKQMTIDFWHQQHELYRDANGRPIELEWLKWMVKVSRELPEALTKKDFRQAMGMRQQLFAMGEFKLEGDAPYLANGGSGGDGKDFFSLFMVQPEKFERQFSNIIKGLEDDAKYGPVSKWPKERKAVARSKMEPLFNRISSFMQNLNAPEAVNV